MITANPEGYGLIASGARVYGRFTMAVYHNPTTDQYIIHGMSSGGWSVSVSRVTEDMLVEMRQGHVMTQNDTPSGTVHQCLGGDARIYAEYIVIDGQQCHIGAYLL